MESRNHKMSNKSAASETCAPRGNYVLLSADGLHLLLPQHEVGAVSYLDGMLTATDVPGILQRAGARSETRFAALSKCMTLLPECPANRFLLASLGDDVVWCWNDLKVLTDVELPLHSLPPVLLKPGTPVTHYVELEDKLAFMCMAAQLRKFALGRGSAI